MSVSDEIIIDARTGKVTVVPDTPVSNWQPRKVVDELATLKKALKNKAVLSDADLTAAKVEI